MFLLSIDNVQETNIMIYDAIIKGIDKQLQCESQLEDKGKLFLLMDITDHNTIKGIISSYEVLINREDYNAT